ncbi:MULTISPECIES: helix-turn-helix domain-containing protein [Methylomonas]|uniref:Transcriptional regulator n=2 Tax=Methylomonas TaxID=416 RepID=A0A126T4A7_9GAMM|nr:MULTISPECIES: helix-turn-helix transcriptional regulator [Methylomonas]AMK76919.1 transcriptional regulator [Methylomonas denitrificans]OAH97545.1 transcriptional regulator [Methylomonas methanica]TCV73881.1 helix-turn-helix protein [Methylomonas methanica]
MSPFSQSLISLRSRYGIRQGELAEMVGYEQSYISALEVGLKGPPTTELVDRICDELSLSDEERQKLHDARDASQRKFTIDVDTREDVYWMFKDLMEYLSELSEAQVRVIREVVRIRDQQKPQIIRSMRRTKRHKVEEATM